MVPGRREFASYLETTTPARCLMMTSATAQPAAALYLSYLARAITALLLLQSAPAQQTPDQTLALYSGQTVSSVEVAGQPGVTFESVRNLITVKQGSPLTQTEVDTSIKALKERGGFQGAHVDIEPEADGVRVEFILQPAVYVSMYEFPGAVKEFPYSRLLQVANYQSQAPYSSTDVQQAVDALVQFFREQGYFLAEVRSEVVPDANHALAIVVFHTDLGVRARFGKIDISGATPQQTQYLQRELRTVMARIRGDSLKPGMKYSYNRLQGATRHLQAALVKQDYLAASVKLISANYDVNTNRADITFQATSGNIVRVRAVGAHVWTRTLHNLVPMYQEGTVNDELISEGQQNILSYFQPRATSTPRSM